jgi:hypothetical protein
VIGLPLADPATGALAGALSGGATAWLAIRRHQMTVVDDLLMDDPIDGPLVTGRARDAIEGWARETGRPEFGPFLAKKVRVAESISRRRARRDVPTPRRWVWPW